MSGASMCTRRDFCRRGVRALSASLVVPSLARSLPFDSRGSSSTGLVYDDIFLRHTLGTGHPESPARLEKIMEYVAATGLGEKLRMVDEEVEAREHILRLHTEEQYDTMQNCGDTNAAADAAVARILGTARAIGEGTITNAFCAVRPPGHHAFEESVNRDGLCQGQGFCFYSNAALAAEYVRSELGIARVLIVDWDFHHGNGTEHFFYDDPSVLFFSTHKYTTYPYSGDPARTGEGDGEGYNINVHLDCGATDTDIKTAFNDSLLPRIDDFKPGFIIISAGFDSRMNDTLGCFDITDKAFAELTGMIMEVADVHAEGRVLSLLEGGYNVDGLARAVCAHTATLAHEDWRDFVPVRTRSAGSTAPARSTGLEVRGRFLWLPSDSLGQGRGEILIERPDGTRVRRLSIMIRPAAAVDLRDFNLPPGAYIARVRRHGLPPASVRFTFLR